MGALLVRANRGAGGRGELGHQPDPYVRAVLQAATGRDLGDVRVHSGARAAALLARAGSDAVAVGRDVLVAPEYDRPQTVGGRALLLHELVHVLQQQGDAAAGVNGGLPSAGEAQRQEQEATDLSRLLVRRPPLPDGPPGPVAAPPGGAGSPSECPGGRS